MGIEYVLITDIGSTTTKALLFREVEGEWRLAGHGESPTTVESPHDDVMIGVWNSIAKIEKNYGVTLLKGDANHFSIQNAKYLSTSSAGGGLQMVVCGHVGRISADSAQRAALGGGAVLLDVFSADDGRTLFQRLEKLKTLRPDIILLSGGVEGAEPGSFLIEMCDFIRSAQPKPKFGYRYSLPVIYAGTSKAVDMVNDLLGDRFTVKIVDNLRPSFQEENIEPTRNAIHNLFIEHVMEHAPGYVKLKEVVSAEMLPTPVAVGEILTAYAKRNNKNLLCIDIGGATTDVFSTLEGKLHRTVSANYGMSYSIGHVTSITGYDNLQRWLPAGRIKHKEMLDIIGNKLIRPTKIPITEEELLVEQSVCREALRLAFIDHCEIAKANKKQLFFQNELLGQDHKITIDCYDAIIGSGGALSHAPEKEQTAQMLIDAFEPEGLTELMVDTEFMLPHLGIFSKLNFEAAVKTASTECLLSLGLVIAPTGYGEEGTKAISIKLSYHSGHTQEIIGLWGELICYRPTDLDTFDVEITVFGTAKWSQKKQFKNVNLGICGLFIDLRGRPLNKFYCKPDYRK